MSKVNPLSEETLTLIPDFTDYVFNGGSYKERTRFLNSRLNYPVDKDTSPKKIIDSRIFKGYCGKYLEFREDRTIIFIPFGSIKNKNYMPTHIFQLHLLPVKEIYKSDLIREGYYLMMDSIRHIKAPTNPYGNASYNRSHPFLTKLSRDLLYCILLDSGVDIYLNSKRSDCGNKISVTAHTRDIELSKAIYASPSSFRYPLHVRDEHTAFLSLLNLQEYNEFNVAILERFFKIFKIEEINFNHKKMKDHLKSQEKKFKKKHK